MQAIYELWPDFVWRGDAYEYEPTDEKHALEQLIGSTRFRDLLENRGDLEAWIASWDNGEFLRRREDVLIYR